jgi:hypothetical protein
MPKYVVKCPALGFEGKKYNAGDVVEMPEANIKGIEDLVSQVSAAEAPDADVVPKPERSSRKSSRK